MRSKLIALLALGMLFAWVSPAQAYLPEERSNVELFTSSGAASTITSDHRILGFICVDSSAGACGLYDSTDGVTATASTVILEAPLAAGVPAYIKLPYPLNLDTGLSVLFTNSTGVAMVLYE